MRYSEIRSTPANPVEMVSAMSWSPRLRKKLNQLTITDETWQIGCPTLAAPEGSDTATWIAVVQADGRERATASVDGTPGRLDWLKLLKRAMLEPDVGLEAARPARLAATGADMSVHVHKLAEPLQIEVVDLASPDPLNAAMAIHRQRAAEARPATADAQEVRLYRAAADYMRLTPWTRFFAEPRFVLNVSGGIWPRPAAIILGGGGAVLGLAVYRDHATMVAAHGHTSGQQRTDICQSDSVAVWFDRGAEVNAGQRWHARRSGLPLCGDWHPTFIRVRPGRRPKELDVDSPHASALADAIVAVSAWIEALDLAQDGPLVTCAEVIEAQGGRLRCRLDNPLALIADIQELEDTAATRNVVASSLDMRVLTEEPVAIGFLRLDLDSIDDPHGVIEEHRPAVLRGSRYVPVISLASTVTGLAPLMDALAKAGGLVFGRPMQGTGWILLARGDEDVETDPGALVAAIEQDPTDMDDWLAAVEAAQDQVLVQCFETDGATPVQAVDDESLRGSYQLTVEGAEVMRSGFHVPPAGRSDA